jgi:hypothetical protein
MERWPTRHGIALPPHGIKLPEGKGKTNNHHSHWTSTKFEKTAATLALRDLERHQFALPLNTHRWLHDHYEPPEVASEEQAAKEVIDAYDQGERFKIYDRYSKSYFYQEIPLELVDGFISSLGLRRVYVMAAD